MCTGLEEGSSYEVFHHEKKTKMSFKMALHLTHTFDLQHFDFMRLKKGFVIEGKDDGKVGGPPNIEQLVVVQKKELKKKRIY